MPWLSIALWKRPKRCVRGCGLLVVGDAVGREEPGAHGADAIGGEGTPAEAACAATPSKTALAVASSWGRFGGVVLEVGDGGDTGGHGE